MSDPVLLGPEPLGARARNSCRQPAPGDPATAAVVTVGGELDIAQVAEVDSALRRAPRDGPPAGSRRRRTHARRPWSRRG